MSFGVNLQHFAHSQLLSSGSDVVNYASIHCIYTDICYKNQLATAISF